MPKKVDYPRGSLKGALDLSRAIKDLGGSCDKAVCAEKLGNSPTSGAFADRIANAVKFGLIVNKKGILSVSQIYNNYNLSYSEEERQACLQKMFFNVSVFKEIYEKYKGVKLPIEILDKALVREFNIDEKIANKVGNYFISAAKLVGILNADNSFNNFEENEELNIDNNENLLEDEVKDKKLNDFLSNKLDVGTSDETKYQKFNLALANGRKAIIIVPTDINQRDVLRLSKLLELTIIE